MNSSFLRISATRNALKIVEIMPARLALVLDELTGAAGALDRLAGARGELCAWTVSVLVELAAAEDLDRHVLRAFARPVALSSSRPIVAPSSKRALEIVQVHVLRVRPEHLERHRHLLVRAAQLAHPHVERVLTALEARALLGAGTRVVALVAAAGRLAVAGPVTAADALAVLAWSREPA